MTQTLGPVPDVLENAADTGRICQIAIRMAENKLNGR
jgi:hypothetical protein